MKYVSPNGGSKTMVTITTTTTTSLQWRLASVSKMAVLERYGKLEAKISLLHRILILAKTCCSTTLQ